MSELKSVVIGTAGHIDHGKTALVRKLTGIDTDRLPEEKRRGISIDLGFASLETSAGNGERVRLSFVDVPGHKAFIRNMLAGSGGVDCILLVISAEEGVKPQTEEHLAICSLLGITRGITVLTKADTVDEPRLEATRASVKRFLQGTFLSEAPIIPVSAKTGFGIPSLLSALETLARQPSLRESNAPLRIPLDRAFTLKGFGTVVAGTVQSGTVTQGQLLAVLPGGHKTKVRGLHIHNAQRGQASAGSRVALNLSGVGLSQVGRGYMLVADSALNAVSETDVELKLLQGSLVLKDQSEISFHAFTSATSAKVILYGSKSIQPGETALAKVKLGYPIVLLPGDRFVLRQPSPPSTIGGGQVLDASPLPRQSRAKRLEWVKALQGSSVEKQILLRIKRRQADGIAVETLTGELGFSPEHVAEMARSLTSAGQVVFINNETYVDADALNLALARVLSEVKSKVSDGLNAGWKRSELRQRTGLNETVLQFVIGRLERDRKITVEDDRVIPFGSAAKTSAVDSQKLTALEQAYARAGTQAPLLQSVALALKLGEVELRKFMTILLREKVLVKIGAEDLYMHRDVLSGVYKQVRTLRGELVDIGKFKQLTGLSRKYAVPLLEHLDREHITRRQGDSRLVL